jgi:predicted metal-dependent phosphoesterase TrpH
MIVDFHVHSSFSFDCKNDVRKILMKCKKIGINTVAITDHNTIKGGVKALSLREKDIIVIVGSEVSTEKGDLTGLFLNEEIKSRLFDEVVDEIRAQDGMAILPHPFRYLRPVLNGIEKNVIRKIDVIEKINYRDHPLAILLSKSFAEKSRMPFVGGSDAHRLSDVGKVRTIVYDAEDLEELRKSILKKRVKILFDLDLYYRTFENLFRLMGGD